MATPYRKLYRSRQDRMLFGVCGGLGTYFSVDPTVVRLLFVLAFLLGGHGLLAYLIIALVVPIEPESVPTSG
ncbi:MAG TPA: PspC domain-containing protein [Anaerolineales bacterium]|nr:PspC domain-containing protein [Anaerolineales bacterium]